jgi:hypothetical protein
MRHQLLGRPSGIFAEKGDGCRILMDFSAIEFKELDG